MDSKSKFGQMITPALGTSLKFPEVQKMRNPVEPEYNERFIAEEILKKWSKISKIVLLFIDFVETFPPINKINGLIIYPWIPHRIIEMNATIIGKVKKKESVLFTSR